MSRDGNHKAGSKFLGLYGHRFGLTVKPNIFYSLLKLIEQVCSPSLWLSPRMSLENVKSSNKNIQNDRKLIQNEHWRQLCTVDQNLNHGIFEITKG